MISYQYEVEGWHTFGFYTKSCIVVCVLHSHGYVSIQHTFCAATFVLLSTHFVSNFLLLCYKYTVFFFTTDCTESSTKCVVHVVFTASVLKVLVGPGLMTLVWVVGGWHVVWAQAVCKILTPLISQHSLKSCSSSTPLTCTQPGLIAKPECLQYALKCSTEIVRGW